MLGVGSGTAKLTLDAHRAVDVALNAAFARGLRGSGKVRHLAFMSAAGADPSAKATGSGGAGMSRYNRVKGEAEEAVRASGPAVVSVFRPAMIIGSQHTPWILEKTIPLFSFVTPAKFKSITVEQIAQQGCPRAACRRARPRRRRGPRRGEPRRGVRSPPPRTMRGATGRRRRGAIGDVRTGAAGARGGLVHGGGNLPAVAKQTRAPQGRASKTGYTPVEKT